MRRTFLSVLVVALAVMAFALPSAAQTTLFSESFDGVNVPNLPAGWAVTHVTQNPDERDNWGWTTQTSLLTPTASAHSAPNVARFNSYLITSGNTYRLYRTTPARLGCALTGTVTLSFWMYHNPEWSDANDRIQIQYSTDGGNTWNNVAGALFTRYAAAGWAQHDVDLTTLAQGQRDFRIAFYAISEYGYDMYVDDVSLTASAAIPVPSYAYSTAVDHCEGRQPDYVIDPGESVEITPYLSNAGTAVGANFQGTITTTTPGVTIPTNTVVFPAIPIGSSGTAADSPFVVEVGIGVPCTTLMQFHLVGTNGTCTFEGDFTLRVGVHDNIPVAVLYQPFDSAVTPPALPAGWSTVVVGPAPIEGTPPQWFTNSGTHQPPGQAAISPPNCAYLNSYYDDTPSGYKARLQSPAIDFSPYVEGAVSFYIYHANTGTGYYNEGVQLQYSLDGTNWTDLGAPVFVYSPTPGWDSASFWLPPATDHQPALYVGLLGVTGGGWDCNIDNFVVIGTNYSPCNPCAATCTINSCTATAPPIGFAGHAVSFTGAVDYTDCTGTPTWSWTFGDGGTSTDQNPTHTYAAPGDYTYSLTVTIDGVSCTTGGVIPICTLSCSASATPVWGFAPLTVNFTASATIGGCTLPTRQVITYLWNFGDGTTSTDQNPAHLYSATGTHIWTCTATVDGVTCQSRGYVQVCTLTCSASASPTTGYAPLTVNFTSSAAIGGCTPPTKQVITYLWDFGDSATSTDQNPTHTYTAGGTFHWTCTITVDGTPCVQTGVITAGGFDLHFRDDYGTTWLCVDSASGFWVLAVFSGGYPGIYTGKGAITYAPDGTLRLTGGGRYPQLQLWYKAAMHQAHAELWMSGITRGAQLKDMNTLDDPPECPSLGPGLGKR